jgi:tryptophanyl-tRNA synthetase
VLPEAVIDEKTAVLVGLDGRKMSKSYGNVIPLFATDEEIKKAVMSIPTDSKGVEESKDPETNGIFAIHKLLLNEADKAALALRYKNGGLGYKEAKEGLIGALKAFIGPMRDRRALLASDLDHVFDILKEGGQKARNRAEKKMQEIRQTVGVEIY